MSKVWEETWVDDWNSDYGVSLKRDDGVAIGRISAGGPEGVARARLAASAPDLVRVLLAVDFEGGDGGRSWCPSCYGLSHGEGHAPDCDLLAALRKAGVR